MKQNPRPFGQLLLLGALLAVALAVRLPAIDWSVRLEDGRRKIVTTDESTFLRHFRKYPGYKHSYVSQTNIHAMLLYPIARWAVQRLSPQTDVASELFVCQVGRLASLFAGLALIALFFFAAGTFGVAAGWPRVLLAGLLAFCPPISVYSHFFLGDVLNIFWIWLGYAALLRFCRRQSLQWIVLFSISAGFATATKISVPYFVLPALLTLAIARRPLAIGTMAVFCALGAFWLGNGLNYGMEQIRGAYGMLRSLNDTGSGVQVDLLLSFRNQALFCVAAVGLPSVVCLIVAVAQFLRRKAGSVGDGPRLSALAARGLASWRAAGLQERLRCAVARSSLAVPLLGLTPPFLLLARSEVGGIFARHILPFVPLLFICVVRWLAKAVGQRARLGWWVTATMTAYQLLFCLDGERGFYADPRQRARAWLREHYRPKTTIVADTYAGLVVSGLDAVRINGLGASPVPRQRGRHLLVTHQMMHGRYLHADSCSKIHHCYGGEPARRFFTQLLVGDLEDRYRLRYQAAPGYLMPEHRVLHRVVPIQPFSAVGEIRIYEHVPSAAQ